MVSQIHCKNKLKCNNNLHRNDFRYRDTTILKESEHIRQTFDGKTATLHVVKVKRSSDSGVYKCVIKNDSGMDETSATITVKKVETKKKKKEEEVVEETIDVEEELSGEVKRGPFGVLLTKATQNRPVYSVSSNLSKFRLFFCRICCIFRELVLVYPHTYLFVE